MSIHKRIMKALSKISFLIVLLSICSHSSFASQAFPAADRGLFILIPQEEADEDPLLMQALDLSFNHHQPAPLTFQESQLQSILNIIALYQKNPQNADPHRPGITFNTHERNLAILLTHS